MPATILEKYGEARLPRYTSYPTAPRFSPAIGAGSYSDWLGQLPAGNPVSLYLHIPFCRTMCWYCGCHTTITRQDQPILDYLTVLRDEIRMVAGRIPPRLPVGDVHFGGGTPTIMEPAEFRSLIALLREHYDFADSTGIAVEVDRALHLPAAGGLRLRQPQPDRGGRTRRDRPCDGRRRME